MVVAPQQVIYWYVGLGKTWPYIVEGDIVKGSMMVHFQRVVTVCSYEGCSGSSWNLVITCSNIDILFLCIEISQVDIIELASRS